MPSRRLLAGRAKNLLKDGRTGPGGKGVKEPEARTKRGPVQLARRGPARSHVELIQSFSRSQMRGVVEQSQPEQGSVKALSERNGTEQGQAFKDGGVVTSGCPRLPRQGVRLGGGLSIRNTALATMTQANPCFCGSQCARPGNTSTAPGTSTASHARSTARQQTTVSPNAAAIVATTERLVTPRACRVRVSTSESLLMMNIL